VKWGEMTQTLYAHMNKRNFKKDLVEVEFCIINVNLLFTANESILELVVEGCI
jgi:hypothetical protein